MPRLARLLFFLAIGACAPVHQKGQASWYGPGFAGRPTASGVKFRPWKKTAAHPSLPLGTIARVTRVDTGKSVRVVINDRGPYHGGRIIDLSKRSARKLDMLKLGVATVEVRVLGCKKDYGKYGKCD
jgi:rare lipoprotein A